ncbi:hypothetical protein [Psychroserpens sp. S379A]|uniref:hypothetical protein n=1 Tax=Psychroserpens sp. S379A TaxID=3415137 RepID=UPI003C7A0604
MEKAAKVAFKKLLINSTLDEIKILKKCDPEMNVVNVKYILDDTKPHNTGHLTIKLN